ncbi:MAG: SET domain-containing protein-lysine N-methyltransferase [Caldimonas sp.]
MYPKKSMARKTLPKPVESRPNTRTPKSIEVRASGVHGKGVFAVAPIAEGKRIIEYTGPIITWKEAQRRHPHDPDEPNHTFFFHIDDKRVIDGLNGGPAKWINHACEPNCEADEDEDAGRVFIKALRDIEPGEELNYDYGLVLEGRHTAKVKKEYECRCGSPECRGTMLSPKR